MDNWYLQNGKESDIVISSRIRLARNLEKYKFQGQSTIEEKEKILEDIKKIVPSLGNDFSFISLNELENLIRLANMEKHMLSPEFCMNEGKECAYIVNKDENVVIMLNEEDHIRIQTFCAGLDLEYAFSLAKQIDQIMEKFVSYAYHEKYGYLTACPTNAGTGLKASVMVHLPALRMTGNIRKVLQMVNNLGMNIRGIYGEGTESEGDVYQISNHQSIGLTEEEIIGNIKVVTEKIMEQERLARKHLGEKEIELANEVWRGFGILQNARKIESEEAKQLISKVKLGTDMGIIPELSDSQIKKMELYTQPGNLQLYIGKKLNAYEREIARAEIIQGIIKEKS